MIKEILVRILAVAPTQSNSWIQKQLEISEKYKYTIQIIYLFNYLFAYFFIEVVQSNAWFAVYEWDVWANAVSIPNKWLSF